jgi:competence protein ComEC
MYILGVLVILGAMPKKPLTILCLSFLIQIIFTPGSGNTLSFILSYLALLGIIVISRRLHFIFGGTLPNFILQPLSMSCGAFLATAGIVSFSFGIIAPVGIIAGLFIVPLITLFMTGSIIWLVLDIFSLSSFFEMPLSALYRIMEYIISLSAKVPLVSGNSVSILTVSILLILVIAFFENKQRVMLAKLKEFS